jgi:hypothetical protein
MGHEEKAEVEVGMRTKVKKERRVQWEEEKEMEECVDARPGNYAN